MNGDPTLFLQMLSSQCHSRGHCSISILTVGCLGRRDDVEMNSIEILLPLLAVALTNDSMLGTPKPCLTMPISTMTQSNLEG